MLHNSVAKPDEETEKTVETNISIDDTIDVYYETDETNGTNELVGTDGREQSKGANETDDGNYEKKKSKMDRFSNKQNLY